MFEGYRNGGTFEERAPCSCKVGSIGPAGSLLVNIYQIARRLVPGDCISHRHPNHNLKSEARHCTPTFIIQDVSFIVYVPSVLLCFFFSTCFHPFLEPG
jgi:hypothetical protein